MLDEQLNSVTGIEDKARELAHRHAQTRVGSGPRPLLDRLADQAELLQASYQTYRRRSGELTTSAVAEWMLDNFYVVKQVIAQVEEDLPAPYYDELPKVISAEIDDDSAYQTYPRVYALAREYISLETCQIKPDRLHRFLAAYQAVSPLTMGEVGALPTMLRIGLLACLAQANGRVTELLISAESLPAAMRYTFDTAEDKDVVANGIVSLRLLDNTNWQTFFERVNVAEQILRDDPAGLYAQMTFETRDQYRKVVETRAKATELPEQVVAQTAIDLALDACDFPAMADDWDGLTLAPRCHVGFYLLDEGLTELDERLGYRPSGSAHLRQTLLDHPLSFYLGTIALLTLLLLAALLGYTQAVGGEWWQVALAGLVGLIPISAVAVSFVNWLVSLIVPPRVLPKLDFDDAIPDSCQTMVVIPAMLTDSAETQSLLAQLEQHYLRNPDPALGFALLTDFGDADSETMPADAALRQQAADGLTALNERYPSQPFYLFHRRRQFNPSEGVWMGWERKRGKLHEFNRLLRGANDTSYDVQLGDLGRLPSMRYVITLDADTILPRDGAQRLIGTLAHPLNQAQFDGEHGRVTSGYTILQPRTEIGPTSAGRSLFTRVFAGDVGLDLYTLAVSDVYQDLFGEGIFVGKGIYDVDAFERSLVGRIPENSLLSHDLFEGVQGRAGLVTDIVLYEDYPSNYLVFVQRAHRWIRGDWQLLPWLMPVVPTALGRVRNDLPWLARWKLFDNLRRSLVAPALLLFFVVGWLLMPGSALGWTLIGLLLPAVALLTATVVALGRVLQGDSWHSARRPIRDSAIRWLLQIAFLPYEALVNLDAIATTLIRLLVTRRHLLQWTTAAHTQRLMGKEASAEKTASQMLRSLIVVTILTVVLILFRPQVLPAAIPLMILWVLASEIAYRISVPYSETEEQLSPTERQRLRTLARRTWLFFEEYVGPNDHWLPPDHYQESPRGVVAHRTSPTNIGLYLLSALSAYDLGYVSLLNLSLRLEATFDTLDSLEKYRGHLLNWIDTSSLHPLPPRYVSTVDSGNLAGALLALKQACLAISAESVWRRERWDGLNDTLTLFYEGAAELGSGDQTRRILDQITHMQSFVEEGRSDPLHSAETILYLSDDALPELEQRLLALFETNGDLFNSTTANQWQHTISQLQRNVQGLRREMDLLMPGLFYLQKSPVLFTDSTTPAPVREAFATLRQTLLPETTLGDLSTRLAAGEAALAQLMLQVERLVDDENRTSAERWAVALNHKLVSARITAESMLDSYAKLADRADRLVQEMDFSFLYNDQRHVFHIGYNLDNGQLDNNYYDLLASEARIASLVAIAKRDVAQKHWLHLARPFAELADGNALLSWSGTMFEYLMPPLLMDSFKGTLLAQSCRTVVVHQIRYGQQHDIPWGISESGFYTFDNARNYQYRAFGAPGTGFKRGLSDDLVIAPYASLLALPLRPKAVVDNIDHLLQYQMMGMYGLYEAIDFTPARLELGQKSARVQSYMAHHQGMIMLAMVNYLQNDKMVERFHAEPIIQSVELLLQEQLPVAPTVQNPHEEESETEELVVEEASISAEPWSVPLDTPMPQVHYLSNGRLGSLVTNGGGGMLETAEIALTRWRPDSTQDDWGLWLMVQDQESGDCWSAAPQPCGAPLEQSELTFYPHQAEFRSSHQAINLRMAVTVAPGADAEVRQIQLTNHDARPRHLRLTSYGEVVLTDLGTDIRHPAFAKLFVESEYLPDENMLVFRRRPRAATESPRYLGHMLVVKGDTSPTGAHESDRAAFIGRNRSLNNPAALDAHGDWLTGTTGATLDPIMALGQEVTLSPHASLELALVTISAETRPQLVETARAFQRWSAIDRAFGDARTQAVEELRRLELPVSELRHAQQLLSLLLYPHAAKRADAATLAANSLGQPGLWGFGISGDYPILLLEMADEESQELLMALLRAHTYWRRRGLKIDLVIVNEQASNYGQPVQDAITRTIRRLESDQWLNQRGGIFVLRRDQMDSAEFTLLQTAARVVLSGSAESLSQQLDALYATRLPLPAHQPTLPAHTHADDVAPVARPSDWQFDNGMGGFSAEGDAYLIYLEPGQTTPAPWINVIANERFGFLASESGGGYTWAENSGENRLTDWRNDPVKDLPAEVVYLRDEETGSVWTPTPQPMGNDAPTLVRHGAGFTSYTQHSHGLKQELRLYVSPDDPVKIVRLRLENGSSRPRRLTTTFYAEWVLGTNRRDTQSFIVPRYDQGRSALLARNPYNAEFGSAVAFMATSKPPHGLTTDRTEFIGRRGSLQSPAALGRIGLSDRVEAGVDPCAAMQMHIDLPAGGSEEVVFLLGEGRDEAEALAVIDRFQQPEAIEAAWQATHALWDDVLGTVQVNTPDPAMNLLLNRWLLYQALACRIWGRSALYQSSGAYGFRDQLQDVASLVHARPDLTREQLLRAARHQFEAGDVLHWWHPPSGRGVRTRITDDLVWLPFVTAHYVQATGDLAVLDEQVPFLKGAPLGEHEEERYGHYETTAETASLYEHCCRALGRATTEGVHGLPLMGAGDWNDGMNRVGIEGKGESVWLGWFLAATLRDFAEMARLRGEDRRAELFEQQADAYRQAIEKSGWDGDWYRRAYYDDGTPLGSRQNDECRIDAIAQSWGVLTGLAEPERARQAMASVEKMLVKRDERLLLLFTPPFDDTAHDPGYIKGYLPGIRENGGQYTHAALWSIWAFAELGQGDKAESLFRLINPIYRSDSAEKAAIYKGEPYVISADVYGVSPHEGRGGWTWYTGSSGWMYRLGVEGILGIHREADALCLTPHIPESWPGFEAIYRVGETSYHICVTRERGQTEEQLTLDGEPQPALRVPLHDDGQAHEVMVTLPAISAEI